MTSTAIELWNDREFIQKRINEQEKYSMQLYGSDRSLKRIYELHESSLNVMNRFQDRLEELNGQ